jgi:hypothetical protein
MDHHGTRTGAGSATIARSFVPLWWLLVLLHAGPGCSLAPKSFRARDLTNPSPLVRARAVTLNDNVPASVVVPALMERMDDRDPVVRLAAHEELRQRTGQDFGYHPWDDQAERGQAIARWRSWWSGQMTRVMAARPASSTTSSPITSSSRPPRRSWRWGRGGRG